jgi:hypothetical protein
MIVFEKHYDSFIVLELLNSTTVLPLAYKRTSKLDLLLFDLLANFLLSHKINHGCGLVVFNVKRISEILLGVLGCVGAETTESVGAIECSISGFFKGREAWLFHVSLLLSNWT